MKKVKFLVDYSKRKAGDVKEVRDELFNHLVNVIKVAEETDDEVTVQEPKQKEVKAIAKSKVESEDKTLSELTNESNPGKHTSAIESAKVAEEKGDFAAAITFYEKAFELNPDDEFSFEKIIELKALINPSKTE